LAIFVLSQKTNPVDFAEPRRFFNFHILILSVRSLGEG